METLTFDRAKAIWQKVIKSDEKNSFTFHLELHRRLLDLFHVGPHYYYIFNCGTGGFEYIDEKATILTGYPEEVISPQFLVSNLHPEDVSYFLNYESIITDFYLNLPVEKILSYKTSYDVRFKMGDGNYLRVLQQVTPIEIDENGSIFRTLGVHTDITHIKPEGKPLLNIIGLNGEPSYYNVEPNVVFEPAKPKLTKREQEIVKLIVEGYSTENIADKLCISSNTVKTHRKNILAKTDANSTVSLAMEAISQGWV